MRNGSHMIIGGITGFVIAYFTNGFSFVSIFSLEIIASLIGSVSPDIIEPPVDYTHRRFFHSKRMLKYLFVPLLIFFFLMFVIPLFKWLFFMLIGYEMHLIADSTTTMGLPE